jgi:hypothetical protein
LLENLKTLFLDGKLKNLFELNLWKSSNKLLYEFSIFDVNYAREKISKIVTFLFEIRESVAENQFSSVQLENQKKFTMFSRENAILLASNEIWESIGFVSGKMKKHCGFSRLMTFYT